MKARLVRIGNSHGIRLPKPLIEEAGLQEEVEIQIRGNALVITPSRARAGWAEAVLSQALAVLREMFSP
jgi:antitoxin MazE